MPNIPNVPGVPSLSSYSSAPSPLLAVDTALTFGLGLQQLQWGIYTQIAKGGQPVIASSLAALFNLGALASAASSVSALLNIFGAALPPSVQALTDVFSVVDFEFKQDWTVSNYPVEEGGFQSYDKVQMPFDVRMRVAAGGAEQNRVALLTAVESIANSVGLYDVVTPEQVYRDCNVTHYDYKRVSNNGVGILLVDIWLVEVRVTSTSAFSNTQQPQDAGTKTLGNVQPTQLPAASTPAFN